MPVIVVGSEKNFKALRPRLFAGKVPAAVLERVTHEVREANPHADLDRLGPGTVLTIPDTPGIDVRGDVSFDDSPFQWIDATAKAAAQLLDGIGGAVKTRVAEDTAARRGAAKALDSKEVQAAAKQDKALAGDLKTVAERIGAADEADKKRTAIAKQAQSEWGNELEALRAVFGSQGDGTGGKGEPT